MSKFEKLVKKFETEYEDEDIIEDLETFQDEFIKLVRSGFFSKDELLEEAFELLDMYISLDELEEEYEEEDLEDYVDEIIKLHQNKGEEVFFQTLDKAFKQLNQRGIVAEHYADHTSEMGYAAVMELVDEYLKKGKKVFGVCFYITQALDHVLEGDTTTLLLDFSSCVDSITTEEIGNIIVEELKAVGLEVEWNGSEEEKIGIRNVIWDKRCEEE